MVQRLCVHTRTGACGGTRAAGCAKGTGTVEPHEGRRSGWCQGQRLRREGWRQVPPERSADEDGSGVGAVVMAQSLKRKATVQRQHKVTNKQYLALGNPRRWCRGLHVHARTGVCRGARAAGCVGARRKSQTQDASQVRSASEASRDVARTRAKGAARPLDNSQGVAWAHGQRRRDG